MLCEVWGPARVVLADRFGQIPLEPDVRDLPALPADAELVTAGFPCTDLSQAGRTAGIRGEQSSLVSHVFRLVDQHAPRWLLFENVRNMLSLDHGYAMRYLVDELERRGYRWAYRLVDSRFAGVPQRRHRVLMLASRTDDPREVVLAEDAGEPYAGRYRSNAFGFYWTEGLRGLGWVQDAVPPLKGGSTVGIPSPPAVWLAEADSNRALVKPSVEDAESLQGFPRGWTRAAEQQGARGARWKLVGNAVTVDVAAWLGARLAAPTDYDDSGDVELGTGHGWPNAAWGENGRRWASPASTWPRHAPYTHLTDLMDSTTADPLSLRSAMGFFDRLERGNLRPPDEFLAAVKEYIRALGC
jgi:DNA (cytosine-5)-methyltransferase 1